MNIILNKIFQFFTILFLLLILFIIEDNLLAMIYIALLNVFFITLINKKILLIDNKKIFYFLLLLAIIIKIIYLKENNTIPISDYKTYYQTAIDLTNNNNIFFNNYISVFPHVFGYPFILSFLFKIFGNSILVGQIFNLFLTTLSLYFIYKITEKIYKKNSAMIATVIVAFIPSYTSMTTIICTEFLFLFIFLLIIYIFIKNYNFDENKYKNKNYYIFIIIGLLLSFLNIIRPLALVLLISFILFIILNLKLNKKNIRTNLLICTIILISFVVTNIFIVKGIEIKINTKLKQKTGILYTLNVGMNYKYDGKWNVEDANYLEKTKIFEKNQNIEKINKLLEKKLVKKLKNNNNYLLFFYSKYKAVWNGDIYGHNYNIAATKLHYNPKINTILFNTANYYYFLLILFSIVGLLVQLFNKQKEKLSVLIMIIFLMYIGMFLFTEAAQRYHFAALSLISIFAANGFNILVQLIRKEDL